MLHCFWPDIKLQCKRKGLGPYELFLHIAELLQFDTLTPIPDEGPLSPVGIYLNISYTAFNFIPFDTANDGLIPPSTPNYAYGAGSATNPAAMSVSYQGSTVQSFGLTSLYYGCAIIPPPGEASLPVPCSITATGYAAGSAEPVAVQQFEFSPAGGWTAPLALGQFETTFQGLDNVTYVQSPGAGTQFFLDNIVGSIET